MPPGGSPRALWLAALLLLAAAALAAAGFEELPFSHLTPDDQVSPLPVASVQKVTQDSFGFIWFGFYSGGLARYDGSVLELLGSDAGLPDLTVREVVEDAAGYLWVGTDGGLAVTTAPLSAAPNQAIRFVTRLGGVELAPVRLFRGCIAAAASGGVWVGARGIGLRHYTVTEAAAIVERQLDLPASTAAPTSLLGRGDGSLVVGLADGSILSVRADGAEIVTLARLEHDVTALAEDGRGRLWAGLGDGSVWTLGSGPPQPLASRLDEMVNAIAVAGDGSVWIASLGDGALWLPPEPAGEARRVTRRAGLLSETVWSVFEDREGTLWFAQNGGVSRLRADYRAFGRITARAVPGEPPVLVDSGTFSVLPPPGASGDDTLWVGTGGGLTAIAGDGRAETLSGRDGLTSSSVYALQRGRDGRVWVGTLGGLCSLSFGSPPPPMSVAASHHPVTVLGRPATLSSDPHWDIVYSLRVVRSGDSSALAVVGRHGLGLLLEGTWYELGEEAGLPAVGATAVAQDDGGRLWLATSDAGVLRSLEPLTHAALATASAASDGGVRRVTRRLFDAVWDRAGGAPSNTAQSLLWQSGRMLVGTPVGLVALAGEPPEVDYHQTAARGLGGNNVRGLVADPSSASVWVAQNEGLAEVDPANGAVLRLVTKRDSLIDNEAWAYSALAVDGRGQVYMATPSGVSIYRPRLDTGNRLPPLPVVRRLTVRSDRLGNNQVHVEYAALSFASDAGVTLRTRLVGFDPAWSEPSQEARIRYTNLPAFLVPRSYRFEVTATNEDGVAALSPAAATFVIQPAWWATWWSAAVILAALAAVITALARWRSRGLKRRAEALEREVAERTAAIAAQAREIETLEDIVRTINQEVSLDALLGAIIEQGRVLLPHAERAVLMMFDRDTQSYRPAAAAGWPVGSLGEVALSRSEAVARWAEAGEELAEGVFLVREPVPFRRSASATEHAPPQCMLTMTMTVGAETRGFLVFDNFSDADAFNASDVRVLGRFRQHAISAVRNAMMLTELEERSREAQQASQAKSAFLANVSHELRTPLNSIIGFSDLLRARAGNSLQPAHQKFVANINESGQHLLSIINDILDLAKVEAGRMALDLEPLDLVAVIRGVSTVMTGVARPRGIEIEIRAGDDLPPLYADAVKLKQILYNLLSNAVKFSPDGSVVAVEVEVVDAARSTLGVDAVQVAVVDHGIGIAVEHQEMVFEAFKQVESSASRTFGGTGLGLALVRRFVELHGGVVGLSSVLGEGSTFAVTLPLRKRDGKG